MKITKEQLAQIIIEEASRFHTGVPDDDWESALDTEKYPVQPGEVKSDEIAAKLEQAWIDAGNDRKYLGHVDGQILDIAMAVVDGDISYEDALEQAIVLENKKTIKVTKEQLDQIIREELQQVDEIFGLTTAKSADAEQKRLSSVYIGHIRRAEKAMQDILLIVKGAAGPGLQSQVSQAIKAYEDKKTIDTGREERARPRLKEEKL